MAILWGKRQCQPNTPALGAHLDSSQQCVDPLACAIRFGHVPCGSSPPRSQGPSSHYFLFRFALGSSLLLVRQTSHAAARPGGCLPSVLDQSCPGQTAR
eukprot:32933-Amphidinium_carterae.2